MPIESVFVDDAENRRFSLHRERLGADRARRRRSDVFAAKDGQEALDGDRKSSPFAKALAKYINEPSLEVRRLFDYVRDDVKDSTDKKQQPFTYGSLPGKEDFYFIQR